MRAFTLTAILAVALVSCKKEEKVPLAEQPVDKKVEFFVFANRDYSEAYYDDVTAEITLNVRKINYRTGATQLLWDTTFSKRPLVQYPTLPGKIVIEKSFPALDSKEKINASYGIRYNAKGMISQQGASDECVPGKDFVFLDIDI